MLGRRRSRGKQGGGTLSAVFALIHTQPLAAQSRSDAAIIRCAHPSASVVETTVPDTPRALSATTNQARDGAVAAPAWLRCFPGEPRATGAAHHCMTVVFGCRAM